MEADPGVTQAVDELAEGSLREALNNDGRPAAHRAVDHLRARERRAAVAARAEHLIASV